MSRVRSVSTALLAALARTLAGCIGQTPVTPNPSPSPTFRCTPEAGGSEAPCSEQQYQEMKAKDALYAEAEQVYRTYTSKLIETMRNGGADTLPSEIKDFISGPDLAKCVLDRLREVKREGLKLQGPDVRIVWAQRLPSREKAGSVAAMKFCGDASGLAAYKDGEKISEGVVSMETVFFAGTPKALTMTSIEYEDVKKC